MKRLILSILLAFVVIFPTLSNAYETLPLVFPITQCTSNKIEAVFEILPAPEYPTQVPPVIFILQYANLKSAGVGREKIILNYDKLESPVDIDLKIERVTPNGNEFFLQRKLHSYNMIRMLSDDIVSIVLLDHYLYSGRYKITATINSDGNIYPHVNSSLIIEWR